MRRYLELLQKRRDNQKAIDDQNGQQLPSKPVGRPKSIITEAAEGTGLSRQTITRAASPRPAPDIKAALEPESEHDAVIREANAIVSAWNRAGLTLTN